MKIIIIFFCITVCMQKAFAQCDPILSHTDVDEKYVQPIIGTVPPSPNNQFPNFLTNTFKWYDTVYTNVPANPQPPSYPFYKNWGTSITNSIANPFYSSLPQMNPIAVGASDKIGWIRDMFPAGGWELVKQDLGYYQDDGLIWNNKNYSDPNVNKPLAYIILYNKYSSKLRVFACVGEHSAITYMDIVLKFIKSAQVSALFNAYNTPMQSLDVPSPTIEIHAPAISAETAGIWFYADFQMAYDPCSCFFESPITVDFEEVTTSTFTATGVSLGHAFGTNDLLNTGNAGSNDYFSQNYLFSYWNKQNNDVGGMMQDFNNVNSISDNIKNNQISSYQAQQDALKKQQEITFALSFLGTAGSIFGNAYTIGSTNSTTITTNGVSVTTPGSNIFGQQGNANTNLTIAANTIGLASNLYNFVSSNSTNDINPYGFTQPMVISTQMVLNGQISSKQNNRMHFNLAIPGTKDAWDKPEYGYYSPIPDMPSAPIYNNKMGLFALKSNPKVNVLKLLPKAHIGEDQRIRIDRSIDLNSISYYLNPLVDIDKTVILAAFELTTDGSEDGVINLPFKETIGTQNIYRTHFYNLECFQNLKIESFSSIPNSQNDPGNIRFLSFTNGMSNLVLSIAYVFKPDEYGKVNTSYQLLKFSVDEILNKTIFNSNVLFNQPSQIENNYLQIHTQQLTGGTYTYSYGDITIDGDLTTTNPNVPTYIIAEKSINVLPGVSIAPNIILEISSVPECGAPKLMPTTAADFCNNGQYKANTSQNKRALIKPKSSVSDVANTNLSIFPNPTENLLNLSTSVTKDSHAQIIITDVTGKVVKIIETQLQQGNNKIKIETTELVAGTYLITLKSEQGASQSKQFVKL